MFKPVNHDSRLPAVLQAHTKQNLVMQLALLVIFIPVSHAWDNYRERRLVREYNKNHPSS